MRDRQRAFERKGDATMRVMVLIRASRESEAGDLPSEQLLAEMGAFNEALVEAGVMVGGDGLKPTSAGARVRFSGTVRAVERGPFPVQESIAGYWIWEVASLDDAIAWAKRCPNPTGTESAIEIRPVYGDEDFGEAFTPELREQEARLRAQLAEQQGEDLA
jgi:hypothetical protein